ncbi:MAG: LuxR C-terminal-related transcriptional regulator, partial [Omnitrophica WOR_2 bacterium]
TLDMLQSPQPVPIEVAFTELVNELDAIQEDFILVLDDHHAIETQDIHTGLTFLIENLPSRMHLVIAGRSDPALPLPQYRARRDLVELKQADLRFSYQEVFEFLNQMMDLGLADEQIAAIEQTTEGWVAGIQLAAIVLQSHLSMQHKKDIPGFIRSFTGRQRYIFDYLAQEVLSQQPEPIQHFLLATSILERLNGPLCDHLLRSEREPFNTGAHRPSAAILESLEQANLFIVPLDEERQWYRYHHLFAEFLENQLELKAGPAEIAAFHQGASQWYEQNHFISEAISHAVQAGDFDRAVYLVLQVGPELFDHSELITLMDWIGAIPGKYVRRHPDLQMLYCWALLATSQFGKVEQQLQEAEQELGITVSSGEGRTYLSASQRGALAEIACLRANVAFHHLDMPSVLALSNQALAFLGNDVETGPLQPRTNLLSVVAFNTALVHEFGGDIQAAIEDFARTLVYSQQMNNRHLALMAYSHLGKLQAFQGHLIQAAQTYRQALQTSGKAAERTSLSSGLVYAGLGNIYYEWNKLDNAAEHLNKGVEFGRLWANLETLLSGYTGLAYLNAAQGDLEAALANLDALLSFIETHQPQWNLSVIEAHRAVLQARAGELAAAEGWRQTLLWDIDEEIPFEREEEITLLVKVLLASGKYAEASQWTSRLLAREELASNQGRLIEVLALQALVAQAQGETEKAFSSLERALTLAEPEGYLRLFLDEGESMQRLILDFRNRVANDISGREKLLGYMDKLISAFSTPAMKVSKTVIKPAAGQKTPVRESVESPQQAPVNSTSRPLSAREAEVLHWMAHGLTNQQIADILFVSLNTVKTHVKNILSCLEVQNRTQAIARARELGILE